VDAVTLDRTLAELRPFLVGRHLSSVRLAGRDAVLFEVSGSRDRRLWLDAARGTAGVYWPGRDAARALAQDAPVGGRERQMLLLLRKHVQGARVVEIERVAGERVLVLRARDATLALRLSGSAPALSLVLDGSALGTLGEGLPAWPPPPDSPEREWDRLDPAAFVAAVAAAQADGRSPVRAVLAACPGLGPRLARETDGSADSFVVLRERLRHAAPSLVVPGPAGTWHDDELADPSSVVLTPVPPSGHPGTLIRPPSWLEAGILYLEARRRGAAFETRRRAALAEARRRIRRLEQLDANLAQDLASLADGEALRRQAEALLAFARHSEPGRESIELDDPYQAGRRLTIALDPRRGGLANAEHMFEKARRVERARHQIELRLRDTRSELTAAREREGVVLDARDRDQLPGPGEDARQDRDEGTGPRHYLTGRGLSVLVGRNARENHHLTFRVARPEDVWLHARDVPGSHVVLRDDEGRAGADDLREAAEVAAFFSEARRESLVDVHVTRRKHVKPGKGGPGRVFVAHSDTLRVAPRDPKGRLRRR
jgi:predicted ribosome quality control (RQC) complex YloA/Tae2 family protein